MFDATYFRTQLAAHIQAAGAKPAVEVHLVNGQGHRVRSVIEAADGYVVLEVHQRRSEMMGSSTAWESGASSETHRAIVSYESITQVVITATEAAGSPRIGFGAQSS